MSTIIICLVLLAIFHFVYEGLIAPSVRHALRLKLLALRDELRKLKIESPGALENQHFMNLQDSINMLIAFFPHLDLAAFVSMGRAIQKDSGLRVRIDRRARSLDDCEDPRLKDIWRRSLGIAAQTIATNSGIALVISAPFALALMGLSEIRKRLRAFASISESDFRRFVLPGFFALPLPR